MNGLVCGGGVERPYANCLCRFYPNERNGDVTAVIAEGSLKLALRSSEDSEEPSCGQADNQSSDNGWCAQTRECSGYQYAAAQALPERDEQEQS